MQPAPVMMIAGRGDSCCVDGLKTPLSDNAGLLLLLLLLLQGRRVGAAAVPAAL
jgi:hypothetical protein